MPVPSGPVAPRGVGRLDDAREVLLEDLVADVESDLARLDGDAGVDAALSDRFESPHSMMNLIRWLLIPLRILSDRLDS